MRVLVSCGSTPFNDTNWTWARFLPSPRGETFYSGGIKLSESTYGVFRFGSFQTKTTDNRTIFYDVKVVGYMSVTDGSIK